MDKESQQLGKDPEKDKDTQSQTCDLDNLKVPGDLIEDPLGDPQKTPKSKQKTKSAHRRVNCLKIPEEQILVARVLGIRLTYQMIPEKWDQLQCPQITYWTLHKNGKLVANQSLPQQGGLLLRKGRKPNHLIGHLKHSPNHLCNRR